MTSTKMEFIIWVTLSHIKEYVDPEKIEAMMSWAAPRKLTDIRSFVGLGGYCKGFTEGYFADKVESMYEPRKLACELVVP